MLSIFYGGTDIPNPRNLKKPEILAVSEKMNERHIRARSVFQSIFINNAELSFFIFISGTVIGAIALVTISGGLSLLGPFGFLFSSAGLIFGATLGFFLSHSDLASLTLILLPTLILEIISVLLSGTASIILLLYILRIKPEIEPKVLVRDSIKLFTLSVVILFISAFIEAVTLTSSTSIVAGFGLFGLGVAIYTFRKIFL